MPGKLANILNILFVQLSVIILRFPQLFRLHSKLQILVDSVYMLNISVNHSRFSFILCVAVDKSYICRARYEPFLGEIAIRTLVMSPPSSICICLAGFVTSSVWIIL